MSMLKYKLHKNNESKIGIEFTYVNPAFDKYRGNFSIYFKDLHVLVKSVFCSSILIHGRDIRIYLPGAVRKVDKDKIFYTIPKNANITDIARRVHLAMKRTGLLLRGK